MSEGEERLGDRCVDTDCLFLFVLLCCCSQMGKSDVHEVVLVGGSTRIPKIQEMIKQFFNVSHRDTTGETGNAHRKTARPPLPWSVAQLFCCVCLMLLLTLCSSDHRARSHARRSIQTKRWQYGAAVQASILAGHGGEQTKGELTRPQPAVSCRTSFT